MKNKYFKLFIFIFFTPLFLIAKVVDENFIPSSEVIGVFQTFSPLFTQEQKEILQNNPSLENLNGIAQKVFLRPAGVELPDLPKKSDFGEYVNSQTVELFKEIGCIGDVFPKQKNYQYVFINGATIAAMRSRIETLTRIVQEEKLDLNATEIVFLTGERDLFESEKIEAESLATEADAAVWLCKQYPLLASRNITFVRAPKNASGGRPTTKDTIVKWLDTSPSIGSGLSISSQPFVYYQEITISSEFPNGFTIEGVGFDKYNPENLRENILVYLDNLARTLYTLVKIKNSQKR